MLTILKESQQMLVKSTSLEKHRARHHSERQKASSFEPAEIIGKFKGA